MSSHKCYCYIHVSSRAGVPISHYRALSLHNLAVEVAGEHAHTHAHPHFYKQRASVCVCTLHLCEQQSCVQPLLSGNPGWYIPSQFDFLMYFLLLLNNVFLNVAYLCVVNCSFLFHFTVFLFENGLIKNYFKKSVTVVFTHRC